MPTFPAAVRGAIARGPAGRALVLAALGPPVITYAAVAAVLALVTATAPGASLSMPGVLAAAGPAWLAVFHVPVHIAGHELGVLPLLPTAVAMALLARTAGNAAGRLADEPAPHTAVRVILIITVAHAVFAALLALACSNSPLAVDPVPAFFVTALFAAGAATIGVAVPCGLLDRVLDRADDATVAGLRAGRLAALAMIAVGAVVCAAGLALSWSTAVRLFHATAPGAGAGLGMFLLCAAYLPNALLGALSFAAGPGFHIGAATVASWGFHPGPLPALPLLAGVPDAGTHRWILLTLLPAAVGVLTGLALRRLPAPFVVRLRAVLLAGLVAGLTCLVLAALAGGALAGGPFDPVTVPAGLVGVAVFALVTVPATIVIRLTRTGDSVDDEAAEEEEPAPAPVLVIQDGE